MSTGVFTKVATPKWLLELGLTEKMRNTNTSFKELGVSNFLQLTADLVLKQCVQMYMSDMIKQRRESEFKEERYDLFSSLLDASEAEAEGELKLTDEELMGGYFSTRGRRAAD